MRRYLFHRLLGLVPVLLGISLITFFLLRLVPCDPAEVYLRLSQIPPTDEMVAAVRAELGLDRPASTPENRVLNGGGSGLWSKKKRQ